MTVNKNRIDVSQCWLVYMSLIGDVDKTAAAMDLDPEVVRKLAKDEGWDEKIRRVSLLSKSGRPGDWERAQNRALCFVQAQRLRKLFDVMLENLSGLSQEELMMKLAGTDRMGNPHYSARFMADLSAAMEKTQFMSYAALGDTIKEREGRDNAEDRADGNTLHAAVMAALNNPTATFVPSDLLVKELADKVRPEVSAAEDSSATQRMLDEPNIERKSPDGTPDGNPK